MGCQSLDPLENYPSVGEGLCQVASEAASSQSNSGEMEFHVGVKNRVTCDMANFSKDPRKIFGARSIYRTSLACFAIRQSARLGLHSKVEALWNMVRNEAYTLYVKE